MRKPDRLDFRTRVAAAPVARGQLALQPAEEGRLAAAARPVEGYLVGRRLPAPQACDKRPQQSLSSLPTREIGRTGHSTFGGKGAISSGIDPSGLLPLLGVLFAFAATRAGERQLPPEVLRDQLLLRTDRLIEADDLDAAVRAMEESFALGREHELAMASLQANPRSLRHRSIVSRRACFLCPGTFRDNPVDYQPPKGRSSASTVKPPTRRSHCWELVVGNLASANFCRAFGAKAAIKNRAVR